jgi:hypothetical protein
MGRGVKDHWAMPKAAPERAELIARMEQFAEALGRCRILALELARMARENEPMESVEPCLVKLAVEIEALALPLAIDERD